MGKAAFCCSSSQERIAARGHIWELWLVFLYAQIIFENPQGLTKNKSHWCKFEFLLNCLVFTSVHFWECRHLLVGSLGIPSVSIAVPSFHASAAPHPRPLAQYQWCSMNVYSTRMQPKTKSLFRYGDWGSTLWLLPLNVYYLHLKKKTESRK